jgi:type VI secretion system protein VasG
VVPYFPLADEVLRRIIRLQLGRIADRVRAGHGDLRRRRVIDTVAGRCKSRDGGAHVDHI